MRQALKSVLCRLKISKPLLVEKHARVPVVVQVTVFIQRGQIGTVRLPTDERIGDPPRTQLLIDTKIHFRITTPFRPLAEH